MRTILFSLNNAVKPILCGVAERRPPRVSKESGMEQNISSLT